MFYFTVSRRKLEQSKQLLSRILLTFCLCAHKSLPCRLMKNFLLLFPTQPFRRGKVLGDGTRRHNSRIDRLLSGDVSQQLARLHHPTAEVCCDTWFTSAFTLYISKNKYKTENISSSVFFVFQWNVQVKLDFSCYLLSMLSVSHCLLFFTLWVTEFFFNNNFSIFAILTATPIAI